MKRGNGLSGLFIGLLLGVYFTLVQGFEYVAASFCISDGVYGRVFFVATGFHGLHVIVGFIFLSVCFLRMLGGFYSRNNHLGFELSV